MIVGLVRGRREEIGFVIVIVGSVRGSGEELSFLAVWVEVREVV